MIFLEKGWSLQHHTEPEQNMNTMVNVAESCFNGKMIALYRNLWGQGSIGIWELVGWLPFSTRLSFWVWVVCLSLRWRWRTSMCFMSTCGCPWHRRFGENCQLIHICEALRIPANLQLFGEHLQAHGFQYILVICRGASLAPLRVPSLVIY